MYTYVHTDHKYLAVCGYSWGNRGWNLSLISDASHTNLCQHLVYQRAPHSAGQEREVCWENSGRNPPRRRRASCSSGLEQSVRSHLQSPADFGLLAPHSSALSAKRIQTLSGRDTITELPWPPSGAHFLDEKFALGTPVISSLDVAKELRTNDRLDDSTLAWEEFRI